MLKSLEPRNAKRISDEQLERILSKYAQPGSTSSLLNVFDRYQIDPLHLPRYSTAAETTCDELEEKVGFSTERAAAVVLDEFVAALTRHHIRLGFGADLIVGAVIAACPSWIKPATRAVTNEF